MIRTDYAGHETAYRRLRAAGKVGWDETESAYREREEGLRRILDGGSAPRTGRVMELGCGAGNISIWLAKRGYEVRGVDLSPAAIDWARQNAREAGVKADFSVGDALNLRTDKEPSFDFVLDGHCLHCIIGEDRKRFLATAWRLLRPGGYFLVDTMCGPVVADRLDGYDDGSRCILVGDLATRYIGLPDEIEEEVVQAGFEILSRSITRTKILGNMMIEADRPPADFSPGREK
jgi:SAM-dependent methyltransferase